MNPSLDDVLAHHAVTQTIYRVARAIDRCDAELLRSCFWPDATDDHGLFKGTAADFVPWVMDLLPKAFERTQHLIGNILVERDGDKAYAEAYFIAYHRTTQDGTPRDMFAAGRYLDQFERRDGDWKLSHRHAVYDWTRDEPASDEAWLAKPVVDMLERGRRGHEDWVYRQR